MMAEPDVMGQIQKERGEGPEMSTQDIVREDLRRMGREQDFREVYVRMAGSVRGNQVRIMRSGNTLLYYKILKPQEEVVFDIMTADSPRGVVRAMSDFLNAMQKVGFKRGISYTDNPTFLRAAKMAGIDVKQEPSDRVSATGIPLQKITVEIQ